MCTIAHGAAPTDRHEAAHFCGCGHLGCIHPGHLRWALPIENQADRKRHGTHLFGEIAPWAILTQAQALEILHLSRTMRHRDVAAKFGISRSMVGAIAAGKRWSHLRVISHG